MAVARPGCSASPSRVAYGYTSGHPPSAGDTWLVTTHDAHRLAGGFTFQGYGWLRFEADANRRQRGRAPRYAPGYSLAPVNRQRRGQPQPAQSGRAWHGADRGGTGIPPNLRNLFAGGMRGGRPAARGHRQGRHGQPVGRYSGLSWPA